MYLDGFYFFIPETPPMCSQIHDFLIIIIMYTYA